YEDRAEVLSRLELRRREGAEGAPLWLDGEGLELLGLSLDGRALAPGDYRAAAAGIEVPVAADRAVLEAHTRIHPEGNTSLEGLYRSSGNFCTQCEAEGFRKITYYPDRPDVMSAFRVRVEADRESCPVLLSNGNPAGAGD